MKVDKNITKFLFIPKTSIEFVTSDDLILELYSDATTESFYFEVLDIDRLYDYFKFEVDLSEIPTGEYTWKIENENQCISRGIIKIVDSESETDKEPEYYDEDEKIIYYD